MGRLCARARALAESIDHSFRPQTRENEIAIGPESCRLACMAMTEYFRWWVVDQRTGQRELTAGHLSRADAQRLYPGAGPHLASRQFREVEEFADTLPSE